jgi:putative SOS response-associated peptidase YedK
MCGRFASFLPAEALRQIFGTVNPAPNLAPSWNLAPTQLAPVVRLHPETKQRHLNVLIWGLIPYFTHDLKSARKPINARAESVATSTGLICRSTVLRQRKARSTRASDL